METGNLAYQTILANHAGYELARVASLVAGPSGGGGEAVNTGRARSYLKDLIEEKFPDKYKAIEDTLVLKVDTTSVDPQSGTHQNQDIELRFEYPAKMVFPISSYFFSEPKGSGIRKIPITIRMPIEKPLMD